MRTRALAGTLTLAILAAACASSEPEVRLGDGLATWWRADGALVIALPLTVSAADATVSSVDDPPGFRVDAIAVDPEPDAAPTEDPSGTQPAPFTLAADATHLVYVDLVVDDCDEIGQSPEPELDALFARFSEAAFADPAAHGDYWSSVRKFKIGELAPLDA